MIRNIEHINNKESLFTLDFIKYYPKLGITYNLSPADILTYSYIKSVIELNSKNGEKAIFFATSKTIARSLYLKEGTINNSISKLNKQWLIKIHSKFLLEWWVKKRQITLTK